MQSSFDELAWVFDHLMEAHGLVDEQSEFRKEIKNEMINSHETGVSKKISSYESLGEFPIKFETVFDFIENFGIRKVCLFSVWVPET